MAKRRKSPEPEEQPKEAFVSAAVSRNPGRSDDYLDTIDDLQALTGSRTTQVERYWRVYKNHGLTSTAINKISAILSAGGSFRVRSAKKGKARKAQETLEQVLFEWARLVNASAEDGVVTGARGLKAINYTATRYALVEGSWVGRSVWTSHTIEGLGSFDLPLVVQTISTANLEPVREVQGTGIELFYWRPPQALIQQLRSPTNKDVAKLVLRYIPKEMQAPLKKDGKALLDPALLMHVRNRGQDSEPFGESFIQPALPALAYEQSILQLDIVGMQSLINRLAIVCVGKSDESAGPYAKPEIVAQRQARMASFFEDPGPNMTIIWAGDDVEVKHVSGHDAVLSLEDRFKVAEQKIKQAFGVPDALLTGVTSDGKAAGWAATIGAAAQLEELASQLAAVWTTLAERIALENGFTDIDIVYEWDRQLLVDRAEERNQNRNDYITGIYTIWDAIVAQGKDPEAVYERMCFEKGLDPGTATWEEAFMPPQGLQGQSAGGIQGQGAGKNPGAGRSTDSQSGNTGPERPVQNKPTENK